MSSSTHNRQDSTVDRASAGHTSTEPGHGNSVAAWTGVAVILLGSAICCLAVVWASILGFAAGAVVILLGVITWVVLTKMGHGEKPHGH